MMPEKIKATTRQLLALAACVALAACLGACASSASLQEEAPSLSEAMPNEGIAITTARSFDVSSIPSYSGSAAVEVNEGKPFFLDSDLTDASFEYYSPLDALGRCGVAMACIGTDLMPAEERGSIGGIKPSGWHTIRYDGIVDGSYLYNRCHLIGYQLTGENANERNLITGTRYMNTEGMEPYESRVAAYVRSTGNHVLYRSTPVFDGDNLVATGVLLEAESVEDAGAGVRMCVWCYNVQPGIDIDYKTGESRLGSASVTQESGGLALNAGDSPSSSDATAEKPYVLNTSTMKFHDPTCSSVHVMAQKNKRECVGTREEIVAQGYTPCKRCNP